LTFSFEAQLQVLDFGDLKRDIMGSVEGKNNHWSALNCCHSCH